MSSFRTALRATLLTAVLVGGGLTTVAPADADVPPLAFSSNLYCSGAPIDVVTFFNDTAADTTLSMTLISSLQSTKLSALVPAHSTADVTFNLTIGERIDKLVFRDADDVVLFTVFAGTVITGTGSCFRQAFDLLELVGYSLTCNDGVTHAAVSIKNSGDYPAELIADADAWFADAPSYSDALQAGLIFGDTETLMATPGSTRVFHLDYKIVDQFELTVRKGATLVFGDGPRTPAPGEGCAAAPEVIETTTTTTDPAPTTTDPAPDTTDEQTDSQAPGATTTMPVSTTVVAQDGRSLPVTGRGSMPVGTVAALLLGAGAALVRATRRSAR